MDAVTLKQLRALLAVSDNGSLTLAAGRIGLTVPAIHAQLAGLESAIEGPLFDRSAGFVPTWEGQAMIDAARRIDAAMDRAGAEIDALRRGEVGRLVLGVVSTAKYFAPRLVRNLMDAMPGAEIALSVGNREATIEGLASGAIDLALMGRPPREPVVVASDLGPHPHGIVLPAGHRLDGRRGVTGADLADEVFLAREPGSGTRTLMTRYLDRIGEGRDYRLVEMDSNETIKQAVLAGLGIAFLSLHTVTDELRAGRLVLLDAAGLPIDRTWYLVYRGDRALPPLPARMASEITTRARALLTEIDAEWHAAQA
ncbi:LysR family transcriptional regulator [Paracoccus suum]|nr:LysR family transcriptional regulator [Paracoccus suum]